MSMDLAKKLYAKMPEVFAKARKKFGRGLTLAEKILVSHADNFDAQTWERGKAMSLDEVLDYYRQLHGSGGGYAG